MKLVTVRHAYSLSNENHINASIDENFCGGLSKKGIEQSKLLVKDLMQYDFDKIITSPLMRTIQTITPYIKKRGYIGPILKLPLVTERDLGDLIGSIQGTVATFQNEHNVTNYVDWQPPNGESVVMVYQRAQDFIIYLQKTFPDQSTILLCSHSVFLKSLDIAIKKLDIQDFYEYKEFDNCEVNTYTF